jgi:hypothetical protein
VLVKFVQGIVFKGNCAMGPIPGSQGSHTDNPATLRFYETPQGRKSSAHSHYIISNNVGFSLAYSPIEFRVLNEPKPTICTKITTYGLLLKYCASHRPAHRAGQIIREPAGPACRQDGPTVHAAQG